MTALIADRNGDKHDPIEVADFLDDCGDRSKEAIGDGLHDAADVMRALATANDRCSLCAGMTILPNFMDAPGGPRCACGRPSVHESGACGEEHNALPCPRCGTFPCWKCRGNTTIDAIGQYPARDFIDSTLCDRCKGTGKESAHAE